MQNEPTTVEKLRGLPWSFATNAANQVFAQFTFFGAVFILFLNQLGLSKTEIGLIQALVPLSSILAPLVAPFTAKYGYKRVFVWFYAGRKTLALLMLLAPWVYAHWGTAAAFWYIAAVMASFAVVRTVEETAYFPWVQEFVPNAVRGKYSAMSNIFTALVGFVAVWVAAQVLDWAPGMPGFIWLFAVGAGFGYVSVWASTFIPGGAPQPGQAVRRNLRDALGDSDFRRYLIGVAMIVLGTAPLATFLPLFMEEQVGLSSAHVVQLQMGNLLGMLISSYLWGWASDRFGSKPVMQIGGWLLVVMPFLWWTVPLTGDLARWVALAVAFVQGMASLGWGIGAGRLLFVSIVPVPKKLDYMAVYFAWVGMVGGVSQFLGGGALDAARGLTGEVWGIALNPYVPLLLASAALPLVAILLFRQVHGDSPVSTMQFAGILLRGNPILAMGSLIRFYRTKDEAGAVAVTERMGEIGSRLTVDELLDALADPRFNVRFEAILAIARMPADPRLTAALVKTLQSKSPALSVVAAWALGRIGDRAALEPLRAGLDARYRSVQAYSARALGTLGDQETVPQLLARLAAEEDEGVSLAYASALGKLGIVEALPTILARLATSDDEAMCSELALAAARLVGDERHYIRLAREARGQASTAYAQAVEEARRHLLRAKGGAAAESATGLATGLVAIGDLFAREQTTAAVAALVAWGETLPHAWYRPAAVVVMDEVAVRLAEHGAARPEYVNLMLHTLVAGLLDETR